MMKYFCRYMLSLISMMLALQVTAASLNEVVIDEDNIIIVDVLLNNTTVARSIDSYEVNEKLMFAIEPVFDALKIRYVITGSTLSIWQDNDEIKYELSYLADNQSSSVYGWAKDDFYTFIELALFEELFPEANFEFSYKKLQIAINTKPKTSLFPVQIIADQNYKRSLQRFSGSREDFIKAPDPITIADKYRLMTVPHGRIDISASKNKNQTEVMGSAQLVADFLYHSTSLTLNDSNEGDLAARLVMSRFKQTPDDYILGLYDRYSVGDVSSITNGISTSSNGGIGVVFNRQQSDYRQSNQAITLQETAPPGWEAELFRNHIFLASTTVPANGLLTFDDVEVLYGHNVYSIKLYGPYGEEETITKDVDLTRNALAEGDLSHSFYALDKNHRLIDDPNSQDYRMTDYGGTIDYGVTDSWQVGFGFSSQENDKQFYNLKNAFTFPRFLIENDLSIDENSNYAQITSIKGGVFERDKYGLIIESADNFQSNKVNVQGSSVGVSANYSKITDLINFNFGLSYRKDDFAKYTSFTGRQSGRIGNVMVRHSLSYFENLSYGNMREDQGYLGSLGVSGNLPFGVRVSADIRYDPEASDPILDSTSIVLQKRLQDPWGGYHFVSANYLPLIEGESSAWRFSHRAAWQAEAFQLNVSTNYDEENKFSFQLGLRFFLGYDYQNNRLLLNQRLQSSSATLDIHTYLDRQLNGVPDPLDYNLTDVSFVGNPEWKSIESGQNGHTILPGVYVTSPFNFAARWKNGSSTINNDYVVYTHPGAYIDVNMPFILSTELVGFVMRTKGDREIGLQNAKIQLYDADQLLVQELETDMDGYYEFNGLPPGNYQIRIAQLSLQERSYTSDVIGFNVLTRGNGGYTELPSISLRSISDTGIKGNEDIVTIALDDENSDPVIWDEDENKRRNYFSLPTKDKVMAKRSFTDDDKRKLDAERNRLTAQKQDMPIKEQTLSILPQFAYMKNTRTLGQLPSIRVGAASVSSSANASINNSDSDVVQVGQVAVVQNFMEQPEVISHSPSDNTLTQTTMAEPQIRGEFVIQLGSYGDIIYAREVLERLTNSNMPEQNFEIVSNASNSNFKLIYGHFNSRAAGVEFANNYIPSTQSYFVKKMQVPVVETPVQANTPMFSAGWIIQFYASVEPMVKGEFTEPYASIGELFFGQKQAAGQDILYCLISNGFTSREEAEAALVNSGLSGWVNRSTNYTGITPVK